MNTLGNLVGNTVDAINKSSGTTLQTFLDKFTNSSGKYVDTLDPLGTFDISFTFFPTLTYAELTKRKTSTLERIGHSLLNSAIDMGESALDNITGGIYSSLKFGEEGSVIKAHDWFSDAGKHTFMEYLAKANLLQGGEQWKSDDQASCPLRLSLGPYVQSITVPNLQLRNDGKTTTLLGDFPINGDCVQPSGELQMTIVNTKAALHERIFYPWMREVTLPFWSYERQPYTTATVDIDFTKHNDVHYVFCGVRPKQIKMLEAKQDADSGNLEREVAFMYDYMFITSDLHVIDSVKDKLMGVAGSLLGGAGNMMNL